MRDRRARVAVVGLLLAFPAMMLGMSPGKASAREAALPVLAAEAILVLGLSGAARERGRLLAERDAPARRVVPSFPHAGRPARRAQAVR